MEKICKICKQCKDINLFRDLGGSRKDKRRAECRECERNLKRERYKINYDKEIARRNNLKNHRNMSIEEYDELYKNQEGKCAICFIHQIDLSRRLAVDHCHETNKIRGLLCNNCNTAIGLFKENIEVMEAAIDYLIKNRAQKAKSSSSKKKK